MKNALLAICLFAAIIAHGQSNQAGRISLSVGYGFVLGGVTIDQSLTQPGFSIALPQQTGFSIGQIYGIRGQYGINNLFSIGGYLRGESKGNATDDVNSNDLTVSTAQGFGVGVEPRIYIINHKKFNLHAAPTVGFSSASTTTSGSNSGSDYSGSASGLNYGLTGGVNIFFLEMSSLGIGMSADFGYNHTSLSGTCTNDYASSITRSQTFSAGGVYIGVGFAMHF